MANGLVDFFNSLTFGSYGVAQQTANALGYDPVTGTFISPAYADAFARNHPGADPATYVQNAQSTAVSQYNQGIASNFDAMGGISIIPFAPVNGGDGAVLDSLHSLFTNPFGLSGGDGGDGSSGTSFIKIVVIAVIVIVVFFVIKGMVE